MTHCVECHAPATELHHVIPKSRGGTFTVPLCGSCHGKVHGIRRSDDHPTVTRDGLRLARERGAKLGRPVTLCPKVRRRIAAMRREGLTFSAIAGRLNEDGVPTARGGAQWWPSTVHKAVHGGS